MKKNSNKRLKVLTACIVIANVIGAASRSVNAQHGNLISKAAAASLAAGDPQPCHNEMHELIMNEPTNAAAEVEYSRCTYLYATSKVIIEGYTKQLITGGKSETAAKAEVKTELDKFLYGAKKRLQSNTSAYSPAQNLLGLIERALGNAAAAKAAFDSAVELDPKNYRAFANRGKLLDDQGDLKSAVADYEKVVALGINDPYISKRLPELKPKTGANIIVAAKFAVNQTVEVESPWIDDVWLKGKITEIVGDQYRIVLDNGDKNGLLYSASKIRPAGAAAQTTAKTNNNSSNVEDDLKDILNDAGVNLPDDVKNKIVKESAAKAKVITSSPNQTPAKPADYVKRAEESYRNGKYYEALFNAERAIDLEAKENAGKGVTLDSSIEASKVKPAVDKINENVKNAAAPLAFKFWEMEIEQLNGLDRTGDAEKNNAAWRNPNIVGFYIYRSNDKWNGLGFVIVKGNEKLLELKNWTETEKLQARQVSKQPKVVILNKKTNKYEVWNVIPVQPKSENLPLSATQNRGSLKPDPSLAFRFENTRLNFDVTLIVPPKDFFVDQEVIEIYDAEGLAMVERNKLTVLRGDKGIADVMNTEAESGNLREAKQAYLYFTKVTKDLQNLDAVKTRRKSLLSKLYATKDADLQKFVEEEMTKYNYTEDEKKAVRSK